LNLEEAHSIAVNDVLGQVWRRSSVHIIGCAQVDVGELSSLLLCFLSAKTIILVQFPATTEREHIHRAFILASLTLAITSGSKWWDLNNLII
jgi:hypothetical protein